MTVDGGKLLDCLNFVNIPSDRNTHHIHSGECTYFSYIDSLQRVSKKNILIFPTISIRYVETGYGQTLARQPIWSTLKHVEPGILGRKQGPGDQRNQEGCGFAASCLCADLQGCSKVSAALQQLQK